MRDDFLSKTKQRLAERVAWHCSICHTTTVGPGSAPDAKVSIGVAAHICAASPGGPRYNGAMTEAERKDISNGIWLCANCAQLIDKNPDAFSVETLQQWKDAAEEKARLDIAKDGPKRKKRTTLIQFGFNIIVEVEWVSITQENIWKFSLHRFIYGSDDDLYDYCASFSQLCSEEKFIAIEVQGDGRQLQAAPNILYDQGIIEVFVHDKFSTTDPEKSGRGLALGEDGDLFIRNGALAMVEGIDCAKQNLRTALSFQRGEWFFG
jgi:ribosomal protein L37AE/L43A